MYMVCYPYQPLHVAPVGSLAELDSFFLKSLARLVDIRDCNTNMAESSRIFVSTVVFKVGIFLCPPVVCQLHSTGLVRSTRERGVHQYEYFSMHPIFWELRLDASKLFVVLHLLEAPSSPFLCLARDVGLIAIPNKVYAELPLRKVELLKQPERRELHGDEHVGDSMSPILMWHPPSSVTPYAVQQ